MSASLFALLGTGEMMFIAVVVLVLFGAKKVPELMKGLGTGIREFKKASRDIQDELERAVHEPSAPMPPTLRRAADTISQGISDSSGTSQSGGPSASIESAGHESIRHESTGHESPAGIHSQISTDHPVLSQPVQPAAVQPQAEPLHIGSAKA
jgi:sec-independent protein translocase protein TatA